MKLAHPLWEKVISWEENHVPVIVVENPDFYYEIISELYQQTGGGDGRFVLSENDKTLDMKKRALFIQTPWEMNFSDRRIISRLYAAIKQDALEESSYLSTRESVGLFIRFLTDLADRMPLPLTIDTNPDFADLLKAVNLRIDTDGLPLTETMITFMKTWNTLMGETCFLFRGFRAFIPKDKRKEFYRTAGAEKLLFAFFEDSCRDTIPEENIFTIDDDLCQIF